MREAVSSAWISMKRLMGTSKFYLILGMVLIFSYYTYTPFLQIAEYYQLSVPPWIYVFYTSFYTMMILNTGLCVLLFSDVPCMDGYSQMMIIRCGRRVYILGQVLYILMASLLYTFVLLILSIIFILPVLEWNADWGVVINTLGQSSTEIQQQTGIKLPFIVDPDFLKALTPVKAMLAGFFSMWLTSALTGVVIGFFRLLFGPMAGVTAAGILAAFAVFVQFIGGEFIGGWLRYLSPLSWSRFGIMDWYGYGMLPSPRYCYSVLIISVIILSIGIILRFCKRDLE